MAASIPGRWSAEPASAPAVRTGAGEADLLETLYRRHYTALCACVARRAGASAEDLVADTFADALGARARLPREEPALRAWLYRAAMNRVNRWMRREGVRRRAMSALRAAAAGGGPGTRPGIDGDLARRMVQSLPAHEQEVIALHIGAGLSVAQIAATLESPEGTIKARLSRARARLERWRGAIQREGGSR